MESPWPCVWWPGCCSDVLFPGIPPTSPNSAGADVARSLVASGRDNSGELVVWLDLDPSNVELIYKQSEHTDSLSPILHTKLS